jgi:MFS family permease
MLRAVMDDAALEQPDPPAGPRTGRSEATAHVGSWAALREDTFRSFWIFSFLAFIGGSMQNVGAGWLMVDLGGSPLQVSLIQGFMSLSVVLAALPSGVIADLYDRRVIMLVALAGMMLGTGAIGLLAFTELLTPAALLGITFLFGLASAGMTPAMQSTLPDLVTRDVLPSAVTLNGMSSSAARSVGPAFAGVLIGLLGAGVTLMANVFAFAGLCAVVGRWQGHAPRVREGSPAAEMSAAFRGGLRFAWGNARFRGLLLQVVACFFGVSAVLGLLPSFVEFRFGDRQGGSARHLGALLSCYGVGSVLGSLAVAPLTRRYDRNHLLWLGTALCGACMLVLVGSHRPAVLGLGMLGAGLSWSVSLTCVNISAQLMLPRELLARGLSLSMMALMVSLAVGSAVWGALATALSVDLAIGIAGGTAMLWTLLQALRVARGHVGE